MGTNPAVSLPRADAVRDGAGQARAAGRLRERRRQRHGAAWRMCACRPRRGARRTAPSPIPSGASRASAPFLPLPGSARPDWWMLSEVAQRLGYGEAFAYRSAPRFSTSTRASPASRTSGSAPSTSPGPLASAGRRSTGSSPSSGRCAPAKPRRDAPVCRRRLLHPDRKARFVAIAPPRLAAAVSEDWPFVLNTGRIRDQWHTMTRTGLSPRLSTHIAEPFVEIHPDDATRLRLEQGTLARVDDRARLRSPARAGQSRTAAGHAVRADPLVGARTARAGRIGALVQPATDPFSGQPEAKATPARIAPHARRALRLPAVAPAAAARGLGLLGARARRLRPHPQFRPGRAARRAGRRWLRATLPEGDRAELRTMPPPAPIARAVLRDGRLEAVLFVGAEPEAALARVAEVAVRACRHSCRRAPRICWPAGRSRARADEGPMVCVCFQVGATRIEAAAAAGGRSVESDRPRSSGPAPTAAPAFPRSGGSIAPKEAGP